MIRFPFLRQVLILERDPVGHMTDKVGRGLETNKPRSMYRDLFLAVGILSNGHVNWRPR